jgi:hypothetical protein
MQNETQNQDTNTQVTQEEFPAQNETPQNQDIDPAVTMSSDDLLGSDPNVTMYPEDLLGPEPAEEPNPNVTMRPEDLLDPEEPDLDEVIYDWGLGRPSEGPETIDIAAPSAVEAGRNDNSDPDIQGGCGFGLEYDEDLDVCVPSDDQFDFFPVLFGEEPLPDTAGGYLALPGEAAGDVVLGLGGGISAGGAYVEKALDWYGEDGGPIGWGFQGLGSTIGFATETAGTIVSGAGEVVGGVSEGVGDAVDTVGDAVGAVGDAAEDAWDEISSWW